jgi:MSHA biogenesis protein MshL
MQMVKRCFTVMTCLLLMISLSSCHTTHAKHQTSIEQIQSTLQKSIAIDKKIAGGKYRLPASINKELMPSLSRYTKPASEKPQRFDITADNIAAKEFFISLVAGTPYNMVVHPDVKGTISLRLKNVSIQQALSVVRDIYGYEYHRTSYGYEITPPQLENRIFHINYLDIQRTGKSVIQVVSGQVSQVGTISAGGGGSSGGSASASMSTGNGPINIPAGTSIETSSKTEFWKEIEKAITNIVGTEEGRTVTVNAQTGVIVVRAYPRELYRIERFIANLQNSLERQVILEAKVLEVKLDDQFQSGIDWSLFGNPLGNSTNVAGGDTFPSGMGQIMNNSIPNTPVSGLTGLFAFQVKGRFGVLINLLQTQGNVQVLSSPRISTVNNQKAVIKVGQDEFFVTGVSTSNTIVGTNTLPSQNISLTPFFSGITLDVTPEISGKDTIILHIHPTVSLVKQQQKEIVLGSTGTQSNTFQLPLAFSTIRETDNIVKAKDGQVVVIGGLMQNHMDETLGETPWASKIPFLGALFRRTAQAASKSELVILLRPIIVNNKSWVKRLEEDQADMNNVARPFHAGGLPEVFGNEAEESRY